MSLQASGLRLSSPEHLDIFSESGKLSNEEHHLQPGDEAADGGEVPLPQAHREVGEWVLVERDQQEGEDEEEVDVGVPLQKVGLGCGEYLDDLVGEIDDGEEDEEDPGHPRHHDLLVEVLLGGGVARHRQRQVPVVELETNLREASQSLTKGSRPFSIV